MFIAAVLAAFSGIAVSVYAEETDYSGYGEDLLSYVLEKTDSGSVQDFIDGYLTDNAGNSECDWYAYVLSKDKSYDFSGYTAAVEKKITSQGIKATDRQRMAIAYVSAGGENLDIGDVVDQTWNKLGIMSEIYGLILLNLGDFESETESLEIAQAIAARQLEDGGWALSGKYSDTDVTAMALQGLSVYRNTESFGEVIDKGLARLSTLQQSDGGYKSYGKANAESCAQVMITLCQLGIDYRTEDEFIKNGNTIFDALLSYRCASGGFSHMAGGSENAIATLQALEAIAAVKLYHGSGEYFYTLNERTEELYESEPQPTTIVPIIQQPDDKPAVIVTTAENSSVQTVTETVITSPVTASGNSVQTETAISETVSSSEVSGSPVTETETSSTDKVTSSEQTATESNTERINDTESISYASSESTTETTVIISAASSEEENDGFSGWKIAAIATISCIFGGSQLYCIAVKRFSVKRFAASAAACAVGIGAVFLINIQSPEEYYSRNVDDVGPDSLTITLSVSCETIADEIDGDEMIIPPTEYVLLEDDTVFTVLERVLAYKRIPFDYSGISEADVYIRGINNIYEAEYGEMSGWMYTVNGEFPDTGCGSYVPEDGDRIEWIYTRNIGKDIGAEGDIQ